MAFHATALKGHTLHTPRGFVVFNEGKETRNIPDEYRDRLVRDGVIGDEGSGSGSGSGSEADADADDELPSLAGKNKAQLLEIAADEGVEVEDGATNAQITDAIEAKRSGSGSEAPTS